MQRLVRVVLLAGGFSVALSLWAADETGAPQGGQSTNEERLLSGVRHGCRQQQEIQQICKKPLHAQYSIFKYCYSL